MLTQRSEAVSTEGQGPSPAIDLPPGGTSIEDLLLQKGTITMDEWIQIRAEQEYKGADQARRLDSIDRCIRPVPKPEWCLNSQLN
jgi:hypothetical protein